MEERVSPRLPQETCEDIIDYLHDDRTTLSKCGVTCRSWLHRARSHLFHTVILDSPGRYTGFEGLLNTRWKPAGSIHSYVRDLTISAENATDLLNSEDGLLRVLLQLRCVKRLALHDCVSQEWQRSISSYFTEVKALYLVRGTYNGNYLRRLLLELPKLSALHIIGADVVPIRASQAETHKRRIVAIDTLTLAKIPNESADFSWLRSQLSLRRLERVEVFWVAMNERGPLGITAQELLRCAGNNLKHLALLYPEHCMAPVSPESALLLDLNYNPQLRSLKLCLPWKAWGSDWWGMGGWLCAFCTQVRNYRHALTQLSRIEIELKVLCDTQTKIEGCTQRLGDEDDWFEFEKQLVTLTLADECGADQTGTGPHAHGYQCSCIPITLRIVFEAVNHHNYTDFIRRARHAARSIYAKLEHLFRDNPSHRRLDVEMFYSYIRVAAQANATDPTYGAHFYPLDGWRQP